MHKHVNEHKKGKGETKFSATSKPVFESSIRPENLHSAHTAFSNPVSMLHASSFTNTLFSFVGLFRKVCRGSRGKVCCLIAHLMPFRVTHLFMNESVLDASKVQDTHLSH